MTDWHPDTVDQLPTWAEGIYKMRPIRPNEHGRPNWLFLTPMIFTLRLSIGDDTGYSEWWDYENREAAAVAYNTWPDGMWTAPAHDWTRHYDPDSGQLERRQGIPPDGAESGERP